MQRSPASPLHALAASPRRTLSALAIVLTAVGLTVGSGANFTAHSTNPENTFTAGTLSLGNSEASAILNAPNLGPGDTATGTVDIQNTGTLAGTVSLSTSRASDSTPSLLRQLDLSVEDCGAFAGATPPACGSGRAPSTRARSTRSARWAWAASPQTRSTATASR
jgi:hypothetical protein